MSEALSLLADNEEEMVAAGGRMAAALDGGLVVHLQGELGMGKTTFSRGLIRALGHEGAVKSPTYTLVEPYEFGELKVYHFDLYRLGHPEELEFMGIRDYFEPGNVCLVEWPERGQGALPPADIGINIEPNNRGRRLLFQAHTEAGDCVLREMGIA